MMRESRRERGVGGGGRPEPERESERAPGRWPRSRAPRSRRSAAGFFIL